jgi:hypothetical protein
MKLKTFLIVCLYGWAIGTSFAVSRNSSLLLEQQHQIDQLCSMTLTLVQNQEFTEDGLGIVVGEKYDFYFANFAKGLAVLGKTDKDGKIHYRIIHNVNSSVLKEWSSKHKIE